MRTSGSDAGRCSCPRGLLLDEALLRLLQEELVDFGLRLLRRKEGLRRGLTVGAEPAVACSEALAIDRDLPDLLRGTADELEVTRTADRGSLFPAPWVASRPWSLARRGRRSRDELPGGRTSRPGRAGARKDALVAGLKVDRHDARPSRGDIHLPRRTAQLALRLARSVTRCDDVECIDVVPPLPREARGLPDPLRRRTGNGLGAVVWVFRYDRSLSETAETQRQRQDAGDAIHRAFVPHGDERSAPAMRNSRMTSRPLGTALSRRTARSPAVLLQHLTRARRPGSR